MMLSKESAINRYDDDPSSSISALAADTSYTTPPYNPDYISRSPFPENDIPPPPPSISSHPVVSRQLSAAPAEGIPELFASDLCGPISRTETSSPRATGNGNNNDAIVGNRTFPHRHHADTADAVASAAASPSDRRAKGFPPVSVDDDENIPLVAATRIFESGDRRRYLANTFAPMPPADEGDIHPTVARVPSNVEQVFMDEPPPPRRRAGSSGGGTDDAAGNAIAAGGGSSSPLSGPSSPGGGTTPWGGGEEQRRPSIAMSAAAAMFDPDPKNPAHRLLWQTGRLSRAALRKAIHLTREQLPQRHAAPSAVRQSSSPSPSSSSPSPTHLGQAARRSASFLRETSVRSATFLQQTTVQAKDRTVDWCQKKDVGTKTKAAVSEVGDRIRAGTVAAYHSARAWRNHS